MTTGATMSPPALTKEVWEAKGVELFGEDKTNWRFRCPRCGNEVSIAIAREKHAEVKGRGWSPESECIGRYVPAVGCDWAAYGLFRGPVFVDVGNGKIPCFDFAGEPFTAPKRFTKLDGRAKAMEIFEPVVDLGVSPPCEQSAGRMSTDDELRAAHGFPPRVEKP